MHIGGAQNAARLAIRAARHRVRRALWRVRIRPGRFGAFGVGSVVAAPARVFAPERIEIGAGVTIAAGAFISMVEELNGKRYDPHLRIGHGTRIGHAFFVSCAGTITIGRDVLISDRVFIGDAYHEYADPYVPVVAQPLSDPANVTIGDGAFVGVGAIILPGVTIGARGYVAAGAVVTRDVAALEVVAGNPARAIRRWDADAAAWISVPTEAAGQVRTSGD